MQLPRRLFLHLTAAMAVLPAANRIATAQIYPTRQVHLIVGFPPGFAPDIVARLIAPALSERLGQQIVVDNRPGAASNIATELVVKANPDGYSLLLSGAQMLSTRHCTKIRARSCCLSCCLNALAR